MGGRHEDAIYGSANHWSTEGSGGMRQDCRYMPQARHRRRELLQLESEVWRNVRLRYLAPEGVGGREQQTTLPEYRG